MWSTMLRSVWSVYTMHTLLYAAVAEHCYIIISSSGEELQLWIFDAQPPLSLFHLGTQLIKCVCVPFASLNPYDQSRLILPQFNMSRSP